MDLNMIKKITFFSSVLFLLSVGNDICFRRKGVVNEAHSDEKGIICLVKYWIESCINYFERKSAEAPWTPNDAVIFIGNVTPVANFGQKRVEAERTHMIPTNAVSRQEH